MDSKQVHLGLGDTLKHTSKYIHAMLPSYNAVVGVHRQQPCYKRSTVGCATRPQELLLQEHITEAEVTSMHRISTQNQRVRQNYCVTVSVILKFGQRMNVCS